MTNFRSQPIKQIETVLLWQLLERIAQLMDSFLGDTIVDSRPRIVES